MLTVRSIITTVALTAAIAACTEEPATQILTGRVDTHQGAVAIRAVSDGNVITAGRIRTDGSFSLALPAGSQYRLEVMTQTGVKNVVSRQGAGLKDLVFKVCTPTAPFDVGGIGQPGMCDPNDPECKPDCQADGTCPPPCNPMIDPTCQPPPPPPWCPDPMDPNCKCAADGTCPPPPCAPDDPSCMPCAPDDPNCTPPPPPPPCQAGDPNCMSCDPATDPYCKCDENGNCSGGGGGGGGMCTDPNDPNCIPPCNPGDAGCMSGCDANGNCPPACTDPTDPNCAPACDNPMDPWACQDPCMEDPMSCGCSTNDPGCWPQPGPCACDTSGMCEPDGTMMPDNIPADFGCE